MSGAGLFAGEITQAAPVADSPTTKPRSYVWFEYGPPDTFVPTSGEFALNKGYAATTDNWYVPSPTVQQPFLGESWPEFTMMSVFKASVDPGGQHYSTFGLSGSKFDVFSTRLGYDIRAHTALIANQTVLNGGINLGDTIDGTDNWQWFHWYCILISYSQTLNEATVVYINLSRGEEVFEPAFIQNNIDVEWHVNNAGNSAPFSSMGYGCLVGLNATDVSEGFVGTIANTFVHDKYIDLTIPANRRRMVGINGIINIGTNGENIFGEVPRIYLPTGIPNDSRGDTFLGNYPADFYAVGTIEIDVNLPPVQS